MLHEGKLNLLSSNDTHEFESPGLQRGVAFGKKRPILEH